MKKIHRVLALLMAALMAVGLMTTAFAAEPTIDASKKASLSIYKYDITKASEDGVWDAESYVSTGLHDDAVIDKLSKYAIQGVEFTYLRVADIAMSNEVVDNQRHVGVLYGFDGSERSNAVLSAIGLTASDAHKTESGVNYFTSDALNNKLAAALAANATTVKNALEAAVKNGGVAMAETDTTGHTSASDMEQGLYLVVETRVPENVTSTCNPFFVSLPMTTIDGSEWLYDLTVYPKNQTGNPTLDKTVREDKNSTGKNTGSLTDIKDGYAHTAAASVGDTVDYQILSTLPTITSKASSLSEYTYVDTLSKGIRYHKNDMVIEFFKDAGCTDKITTWGEDSGKFTVAYDDTANTMTIKMTETGLAEINEATTVYTDSVKRGYRGDLAFQNAEVIDVPRFLTEGLTQGEPVQTNAELRDALFQRIEQEQKAYTESLYHMTQSELIANAGEIEATRYCYNALLTANLERYQMLLLLSDGYPLTCVRDAWQTEQDVDRDDEFRHTVFRLCEDLQENQQDLTM